MVRIFSDVYITRIKAVFNAKQMNMHLEWNETAEFLVNKMWHIYTRFRH